MTPAKIPRLGSLLSLVAIAALTGCHSKSDELCDSLSENRGPAEVRRLLAEGASPNDAVDSYTGWTPLQTAAKNGDLEAAKLLLAAGAKVDAGKDGYETPNHTSRSSNGPWHTLRSSDQAIHLAVRAGNRDMVILLLASGAKVDAPGGWLYEVGSASSQEKPLHIAAENGDLTMIRLLLDAGAKVDAENKYNEQPLSKAASAGKIEAAKLLIAAGAKVNATGQSGSALHSAASYGSPEMITFLISAGASTELKDDQGRRPIHPAVLKGKIDNLEALLKAQPDIEAPDNMGETPIFKAVCFPENPEKIAALKLILKLGANPNSVGNYGSTPLHIAAWFNNAESARILLAAGAKQNVRTSMRYESSDANLTPLELAIALHKDDAAKVLSEDAKKSW